MKRTNSKCPTCAGRKKSKRKLPYGHKGTNPFCSSCDCDYTYDISKSSERNKVKQEINKSDLISSDTERLLIKNDIMHDDLDRETLKIWSNDD